MNNRTFNVIASILFLILLVATSMLIGQVRTNARLIVATSGIMRTNSMRLSVQSRSVANVAGSVNDMWGIMEMWRTNGLVHRHVPQTNAPPQKKD